MRRRLPAGGGDGGGGDGGTATAGARVLGGGGVGGPSPSSSIEYRTVVSESSEALDMAKKDYLHSVSVKISLYCDSPANEFL